METIVNKYVSKLTAEEDVFDGGVHFWTPCHEHPFYASVHKNLTMRYLECDPPNVSMISSHLSAGNWRAFEKNPAAFVERKYGKSISSNSALECDDDNDDASDATATTTVPSHVVVFARERDALARWFQSFQFEEVASVFHAHVSVDRDGQETAHLFARKKRKKYGDTTKSSCSSSSSSSSSS